MNDPFSKYLIYRSQVFRKPAMLAYVPEAYKTYELCLATFVWDDVNSLQYVPDRHKTYELCLTAVTCCGTNIFFVPEEHRTEELKEAAMKQNRWLSDIYAAGRASDNSPLKEPIGYNNAEPGCCDDDISDIEEETTPATMLYEPDEYDLYTEKEIIHRFEFNDRLNMMAATLAY